MNALLKLAATITILVALIAGCAKHTVSEPDANTLSPQEAGEIAREAYIFGAAFVSNYRVFIRMLVEGNPLMQGATFNEFAHNRQPFPPQTPDTTQRDTLFSLGIVDLRREPVVISVPDVPSGQSYLLQMGDTSTETLPYISTLTTKNQRGDYVLVGPEFQGALASDKFDGVITTRGQFVVMVGRTIITVPEDLTVTTAIQDGMQMRPLSAFLGTDAPPEPPAIDFLAWDADKVAGVGVFDYINMALAWHPPAMSELDMMARFSRIGVVPGQPFSTEGMSIEVIAAMEDAIIEANQNFDEEASRMGAFSGNWQWDTSDISRFGTDYFRRSVVAHKNIYPNAPDHAVYGQAYRDANGDQLTGARGASVRFEAGELPPAEMFWSLTLYDASTTAMYPNETGRFALGSTTKNLVYGDDGSLTLYVGHAEPTGIEQRANWLPAPEGELYLVLRLYGAKPEVLNGDWTPPSVEATP
jgi:hypothetical protein